MPVMNRTPPQIVFARVISVMMHPGPIGLLVLLGMLVVLNQREGRER